jgi:hypothetical protein
MELSQHQLQVFLSLVVILGAALVALICDLLKGNNEQLRELALELKVRREEEQKRFQMLLAYATENSSAKITTESFNPERRRAETNPETPLVEAGKQRHRTVASSKEKRRAISPDALAAIAKGAQRAAAQAPRSTPQFELVRVTAASKPADAASAAKPAVNRDWGSLLNTQRNPVSENPLLDAVMDATASGASAQAAEPALPSGFQDGFVLTRLVESHQPVSGLVISIGAISSEASGASLPSNVRMLIRSMIGANDFAAQSGPDEFLLIFPGERGASAQRRLNLVAQQLWDFQLRSLGSFSILFSWGGVEVRSESIDEAIASATERMEETRRGRKVFNLESRPATPASLAQAG